MDTTTLTLLGISLIVLFGYLAEFLFKRTNIPDVLLLMLLGVAVGPFGFGFVQPEGVSYLAPAFTTFALLFLLFDGAFNIDLQSFARGLAKSLLIAMVNFGVSTLIVTTILFIFQFPIHLAILGGVILGGVSSAFVIPVLKQLKVSKDVFSILTLESAVTDVLSIVAALTVVEIIQSNAFDAQIVLSNVASLFAVAGLIGIVGGIIWITIVIRILKHNRSYLLTIAYLLLIYVVTEFMNGNGAIAALFFGLVLSNSKQLTGIFAKITNLADDADDPDTIARVAGVSATSRTEEFFYSHVAFFLKTFFFVYIGILLNFSLWQAIIVGFSIAGALIIGRQISQTVVRGYTDYERSIVGVMAARGLAAATITQVLIIRGIEGAQVISSIVYGVIFFSILLSSIFIFVLAIKRKKEENASQKLATNTSS